MPSKLFIYSLGILEIRYDGVNINDSLSQKAKALLVYLAYTQGDYDRNSLAELVMKTEQPVSSFRREISNLRRALNGYVSISGEKVGMCPGMPYWMDVLALEQDLPRLSRIPTADLTPAYVHDLKQLLKLYRGEFLSTLLIDNLNFEIWQLLTHQNLIHLVIEALDKLIDYHAYQHNYQEALGNARHLVEIDPTRSASYRRLMELLALTDQRAAALEVFEHCANRLEKELNVQPSALTIALYKKIRDDNYS